MALVLNTVRYESLMRGEAFDERYTISDVDPVTGATTPTDLTSAAIVAQLWTTPNIGEVGATRLWTKSVGSGIALPPTPASDGFFLHEVRLADYATTPAQVEGTWYYLQIWFDRAGDDSNLIPVVGGRWRWTERGVDTP